MPNLRNSFTSMDSKSSNDATDEHIAGIFAKYPNDETETGMDS